MHQAPVWDSQQESAGQKFSRPVILAFFAQFLRPACRIVIQNEEGINPWANAEKRGSNPDGGNAGRSQVCSWAQPKFKGLETPKTALDF